MCALFNRNDPPSRGPLFGVYGDRSPWGEESEESLHRASEVERCAFERLVRTGTIDFEQMKAVVGYFGAPEFQTSLPVDLPQATELRHLHAVKPEPVRTPHGELYEVYRLTLACSAHDPSIILKAAMSAEHLKLHSGGRLTAELGYTKVGELPVREWQLMLSPGESMVIDRGVFGRGVLRAQDFASISGSSSGDIADYAIGTTAGLPVLGSPWRLHMVNQAVGQADTLQAFIGGWRSTLSSPVRDGRHLNVSFERERGLLTDRAVIIKNHGTATLKLRFDLPPKPLR